MSTSPENPPVFPGFADLSESLRSVVEALSQRRRELGLSQTQVAARMGTSQSAVARLEAGVSDLRLSTLERYAGALGQQVQLRLDAPREES